VSRAGANAETTGCSGLTPAVTGVPGICGTILLVEDEGFVREVTCEILQSAGYRVLKAANAADAMRAFRRHRKEVQLLITDVVMPGRNGRALADDLRAICPSLRTIFISGYPENAVTRRGRLEAGVFYLPKPFSVESLMQKVREVLKDQGGMSEAGTGERTLRRSVGSG
jgi:two-component system cell cycle sensor histidine kinase/response regulator CckA